MENNAVSDMEKKPDKKRQMPNRVTSILISGNIS
jgi:hypothetical protein